MNGFLLVEIIGISVVIFVVIVRIILKKNHEVRPNIEIQEREQGGNSSGIRFCRAYSQEKTEWHDVLQQELAGMPIGLLMYNPPKSMKLGVCERIETRISQELTCFLTDKLNGPGIPQIEELTISELMKVRLTGEAFDINALNEEEQVVPKKEYTEWAWDVTPRKSGIKKLHLHVTLRIRLPHGEEKKDNPVLDRDIEVKVNIKYSIKKFITKNWKWITTTLAIPLAIWIWKLIEKLGFLANQ